MRSRLAWPAAFSAALLLAGCGGHAVSRPPAAAPKIPRSLAAELARRADVLARRLGAGDACAAKAEAASLRRETAAALPRVPQRLRATLSQDVDALVARIPACAPSEPPRAPAKPKPVKHHEDKHGHGKKHH
jgi:hypothetical protein